MTRLLAFACVLCACSLPSELNGAVYWLNSYSITNDVLFPRDAIDYRDMTTYSVSGYIETDGTLGQLERNNIVDYQFNISGKYSLTLDPTTRRVAIGMDKLAASETELFLPFLYKPVVDGSLRVTAAFEYDDEVMTHDCNECYVTFEYSDANFPDQGPTVRFFFDDEGSGILADAISAVSANERFVIATVPEPAGNHFMLIAVAMLAIIRK